MTPPSQPPTPDGPQRVEGLLERLRALAVELDELALTAHALEKVGPIKSAQHPLGVDPRVNGRVKGKRYAYSHAAQLVRAALTPRNQEP